MPEHICDQQTFLLMIVCTAPGNFEARSAIRKTWGQKQTVHGHVINTFFLIGETFNSTMQVSTPPPTGGRDMTDLQNTEMLFNLFS